MVNVCTDVAKQGVLNNESGEAGAETWRAS